MKKIFYYILLFSCTLAASCSKFLDEKPLHLLVEENAVTTYAGAQAAVRGIYATFENDYWAGALYTGYATRAGFVRYSEVNYSAAYTELSPASNTLAIWGTFYETLNAANFAIKGITGLSEIQVPSEEERAALIAEARCLRAWADVNILWGFGHWWGDDDDIYGIIYRDEPVDLSNAQQARLTVGETYKKIYEDLDYAIAHLGDYTSARYVSKQFAQALKAKILLYRGGYRNDAADLKASLALVNDVLKNHPGSFAMEADLNDVYKNAWDSKECLFARYLEDDGRRSSSGGYNYAYYLCQFGGDKLPLPPGGVETAGLVFGLDWFKADPRWPIATGPVRAAESWDTGFRYTFKKLARLGQYAGKQSSDPNAEKYTSYFFRFSELYLMKAELLARTGASIAEAIQPINEMRAQRTVPVLAALHPSSQDELMDMIFKEIFMENFMENGSEYFAALRFKHIGEPWIVSVKAANSVAFDENKMCWPIPYSEMLDNQLMVQNP